MIRPTAGQWELRARLGWLVAVLVFAAGAIVAGTAGVLWFVPAGVVILFALAWVIFAGIRKARTVAAERAAGYSTVYDFAGFELRDPRTLEVLRSADQAPDAGMRRSLVSGMLTIKPGTVLAKRLEENK